jgi:putative hydrolase of the HAD superfamily
MPVQSVIFDFGGVLCGFPGETHWASFASAVGLPADKFLPLFWKDRLDYDRGDLSDAAYWKTIGEGYTAEQVASFVELDCKLWQEFDEPMLEWNRTLRKAGFKTAILSNMPECLGIYLRRHTRLFEEFDHVTLSYEVRSAKPEAHIYQSCLAGLGVKADEALFLDDKEPNVLAAQANGIHSLIYTNRGEFAGRELAHGLPPLPVDA